MRLQKYITEAKIKDSAIENWIRDQLSGTKRKTTALNLLASAKKKFRGLGSDQFMEVWNSLIEDDYLVLVGGDSYKWEM